MIQETIKTTRRKIKRKILNKKVLLIQLHLRRTLYRFEERPSEDIDELTRRINSLKEDVTNLEANLVILTL